MPTNSSAISDNDFTEPQKPTPQLKRPNRPKEFWDCLLYTSPSPRD